MLHNVSCILQVKRCWSASASSSRVIQKCLHLHTILRVKFRITSHDGKVKLRQINEWKERSWRNHEFYPSSSLLLPSLFTLTFSSVSIFFFLFLFFSSSSSSFFFFFFNILNFILLLSGTEDGLQRWMGTYSLNVKFGLAYVGTQNCSVSHLFSFRKHAYDTTNKHCVLLFSVKMRISWFGPHLFTAVCVYIRVYSMSGNRKHRHFFTVIYS